MNPSKFTSLLLLVVFVCLLDHGFGQDMDTLRKTRRERFQARRERLDEIKERLKEAREMLRDSDRPDWTTLRDNLDRAKCSYKGPVMSVEVSQGGVRFQRTLNVEIKNNNRTFVIRRTKRCIVGRMKLRANFNNGTSVIRRLFRGSGDLSCDFDTTVPNTADENGDPINGVVFRGSRWLTRDENSIRLNATLYYFKEAGAFNFPDFAVINDVEDSISRDVDVGDVKWEFSLEKSPDCTDDICSDDVDSFTIEWMAYCNIKNKLRKRLNDALCAKNKQLCFDMGSGGKLFAPLNFRKDGKVTELDGNAIDLVEEEDEETKERGNKLSVTLPNFDESVFYDPLMYVPKENPDVQEYRTSSSSFVTFSLYITGFSMLCQVFLIKVAAQ